MLAANQTIINPHHSVGQVAHIINDLIHQLELVHCAYQLVQLEGADAVVEHVEQGVNWVVLGLVMVLPLKTLVVQFGLVMVLPLKTLVVTTWACDGAPSEDIGGTAWARFLLGGAQSVLH